MSGEPDTRLVVSIAKSRITRMRDGPFMRAEEHQRLGDVADFLIARRSHQVEQKIDAGSVVFKIGDGGRRNAEPQAAAQIAQPKQGRAR